MIKAFVKGINALVASGVLLKPSVLGALVLAFYTSNTLPDGASAPYVFKQHETYIFFLGLVFFAALISRDSYLYRSFHFKSFRKSFLLRFIEGAITFVAAMGLIMIFQAETTTGYAAIKKNTQMQQQNRRAVQKKAAQPRPQQQSAPQQQQQAYPQQHPMPQAYQQPMQGRVIRGGGMSSIPSRLERHGLMSQQQGYQQQDYPQQGYPQQNEGRPLGGVSYGGQEQMMYPSQSQYGR